MRNAAPLLAVLLSASACVGGRQSTEEIEFRSGRFGLVGDLRFPQGAGPHPVVVFVHGDGPNNRTSGVTYPPIMDCMVEAGYATFAWDKPGTGESTGQIDRSRLTEQRAQIVLDAIGVLKARSDIDAGQIGLWGISQAGYVMPRVLEQGDDVAFMIAVSCPGGPGVEQGIYLLASQMVCMGYPADVRELEEEIRALTMAQTYEEYVRHKEPLARTEAFKAMARFGQQVELTPREEWHPASPEREYYGFDPMEIIAGTSIPVLAVFGEKDTQADPIQGARAYRLALERGGNPNSRVELIPGVDHNIILSKTGCIEERSRRTGRGWRNYAPEYLDVVEGWLRTLRTTH